jgi:ribosomal peptide maturation radical SAM protein 1
MQVLFVNMPFASIRPAIGVSLLKAHLQRMAVPSRVMNFNLRYAERHGRSFFHTVAFMSPPEALIGEWIFSACVFPRLAERKADFLDTFAKRFHPWLAQCKTLSLSELQQARDDAAAFVDECLAAVDWASYDLVGFTTSFAQNVPSLALARRVKERFPRIQIAFGGANCEGAMGVQLHRSFPFIDYVFSGEADIAFPRLIEGLREGQDVHHIPGLISRRDGNTSFSDLHPERVRDLDTLPHPDYDDYFEQEGQFLSAPGPGYVLMETSRGCWWGEKQHCTFCGLNGSSMQYRSKTARRALDEIFALTARHHTRRVEMVDNILDMRYFQDFFPELAARGAGLEIFYETKANLRRDHMALLQAAGVTAIQPGIESFSTHVLRLMRKGTSGLANVQLLKWCAEYGVKCNWNLIYGFPGESPSEYERMADLTPLLSHLPAPKGIARIRLDRFSPNFFDAPKYGFTNVRPLAAYEFIYDLPEAVRHNLAYYFAYDCDRPMDVRAYVKRLEPRLKVWRAGAGRFELLGIDDSAQDMLTLVDTRPAARAPLTVLNGDDRRIYLACDAATDVGAIARAVEDGGWPAARDEVAGRLRTMVDRGIMIEDEQRFLSLGILLGHYMPRGAAAAGVLAVLSRLGERGARRLRVPLDRLEYRLDSRSVLGSRPPALDRAVRYRGSAGLARTDFRFTKGRELSVSVGAGRD